MQQSDYNILREEMSTFSLLENTSWKSIPSWKSIQYCCGPQTLTFFLNKMKLIEGICLMCDESLLAY